MAVVVKDRFAKKNKKTKKNDKDRFFKKKCRFCVDKTDTLDYKDILKVKRFITEKGKILPRRISGNCAMHQRVVAVAIKRARHMALLPFVAE
jgi:small subunit ribosomal protein S18